MSNQTPLRRFLCRNGVILEEATTPFIYGTRIDFNADGYQDEYIIVALPESGPGSTSHEVLGRPIVLSLKRTGFPLGGSHPDGFDIIEELPQEAQA